MIIFDLDGTLYRTHETCLPPLYQLCGRYHLSIDKEDEKYLLCTTTASLLNKIAPEMTQEQKLDFEYQLKWSEIEAVRTQGRLFEGIEELLSSLYGAGIDLAICGMGSKEYIEAVLKRCGIGSYFKYIYYRKAGRTKSEAVKQLLKEARVNPDQCIMIGDSLTDLTAAEKNDVPFIGVSYGYDADLLSEAEVIANRVEQLNTLIYWHLIYQRIQRDLCAYEKPVVLGINGVDTSGKTTFAVHLAAYLKRRGLDVQLIHLDDFHQPKRVRNVEDTPEGYLRNAFDLYRLEDLLSVLKTEQRNLQLDLLDLDRDTYTNRQTFRSSGETIILVEGVMLYRPPVDPFFDYRVFMDISLDQVLKRAKERDVPKYGPEIIEKYMKKYIPAQKMYMEKFSPKQRANLVINNDDYNRPSIQNGRREEKKR